MSVFKINEFDFEVIRVEEYEDGSADLEIHMSEESKQFLINYAFLDIIKKAAGQFEEHFDDNIEAIQVPDRPIEFDWSHEKGAEVRTDINQGDSKLAETEEQMELLEEKYLETLGRNILLQLELNSNITALELGSYAWLVANFVQGESDRDKLND